MLQADYETSLAWEDYPAAVTVGDLVRAAFSGRVPDTYSIHIGGEFGTAGTRRTNAPNNEVACNEPFGDWDAPLGGKVLTITIRDEDGTALDAGDAALRLIVSAMTMCGRRLWERGHEGAQWSATFSPPHHSPGPEAMRFALWRRDNPVEVGGGAQAVRA